MKKLIKWPITKRGDFTYIYRSDEQDVSTQVQYTEKEALKMKDNNEAEIHDYEGSYLHDIKIAEEAKEAQG